MSDRTCSIDTCPRPVLARGWCSGHYQRNKYHGTPEPAHLPPLKQIETARCSIDTCDEPAGQNKLRMCDMHRHRVRLHGDPHHERVWSHTIGVDTCSIDTCPYIVKAMGWCASHWKRYNATGSPYREPLACLICGTSFTPHGKATVCSRECSRELRRRYGRDFMAAKRLIAPTRPPVVRTEAVCYCCGSTFMADKRRWKYCTRECFEAYKNRANWVHMNKRRARLRGALVEVFDRREIFERDRWICQLCMEAIDRSLPWPHPMSPTLDHIIPVALGGKHSRANAQASHALCNMQKGARMIA